MPPLIVGHGSRWCIWSRLSDLTLDNTVAFARQALESCATEDLDAAVPLPDDVAILEDDCGS